MTEKERTWPCAVVSDPADETLYNVRTPDSFAAFKPGVSKGIARQATELANRMFDIAKGEA